MNATTSGKPRIGFIGLGLMGHGIAKNLVTKGFLQSHDQFDCVQGIGA